MKLHRKLGARGEYRRQEDLRVRDSINLSDRYQQLKSLTVDLAFFSPEGVTRNSHIKYKVNLAHAKSVFRIDCINAECIQGDFDLSAALAQAVAAHRTTATGEMRCQGWRCKKAVGRIQCHNILRYTLSLAY
ncbi:MAG: hypothetical protein HY735_36030 [Verrucomicrobia bacterium]|nr:hypothetical protein [Verrucomicrobiota bacterium]